MSDDMFKGLDEEKIAKIQEFQKVTREKDGGEAYAEAQAIIANILFKNNKDKYAFDFLSKVLSSDDPDLYSRILVNKGVFAKEHARNQDAIKEWSKVERSYNKSIYAYSRFYIGQLYEELNNLDKSICAYNKIDRDDELDLFIESQFRIADIFIRQGKNQSAIKYWNKIEESDSAKAFAKAQFNIGSLLASEGETKEALDHLHKISREGGADIYAKANFIIGDILYKTGQQDESLAIWNKIKRSDDAKKYAEAQFNIGVILLSLNDFKGALIAWENIKESDDDEIYQKAKFEINKLLDRVKHEQNSNIDLAMSPQDYYKKGKLLINSELRKNIMIAKLYFETARQFNPYESYCYSQICNLLMEESTKNYGRDLIKLMEKVKTAINILKLDFNDERLGLEDGNNSGMSRKSPERKLAHYTSMDTTDKLLNKNNKQGIPSPFRLNTVSNFNDPSEGHVLKMCLEDSVIAEGFYAPDFDESLHPFISCFTFNHDSLNQFRLYGKTDNREASGVSLVFKGGFFSSVGEDHSDSIFSRIIQTHKSTTIVSNRDETLKINEGNSFDNKDCKVKNLPIMRCVYMDPESNYLHLAQRNRLTFFQEFGNLEVELNRANSEDNEIISTIKRSRAEIEWEKYNQNMIAKTDRFREVFEDIKVIYNQIKANANNQFENKQKNKLKKIEILLNETLIPLRYLIKSSAFQEEQECRIIYITALSSPEVKMSFGQFLYVEYEPEVKFNLDKVYIAPEAKRYLPYIATLLCDRKDIKVEMSKNPYRQI